MKLAIFSLAFFATIYIRYERKWELYTGLFTSTIIHVTYKRYGLSKRKVFRHDDVIIYPPAVHSVNSFLTSAHSHMHDYHLEYLIYVFSYHTYFGRFLHYIADIIKCALNELMEAVG